MWVRTTDYDYDGEGRVTMVTSPEGVMNYEYFPITGRLKRTLVGLGASRPALDESYSYDALGRLASVTVARLNGVATSQLFSYHYDRGGNLRQLIRGDSGSSSEYGYDGLNRLTELSHWQGQSLLRSYGYTLDDSGRRVQEVEGNGDGNPGNDPTWDYRYDELGRLVQETYSRDPITEHNYTATYTYDLVGNRAAKEVDWGSDQSVEERITYSYNQRDELVSEDSSANGLTSYLYDDNGSLRSLTPPSGADTLYRYDLRNHLAGVDSDNDGTEEISYGYDYLGNGVSRLTRNPQGQVEEETHYLIDGNNLSGYPQVVVESSSSAPTLVYGYGLDLLLQDQAAGGQGTHYYLKDGLGSVRMLITTSGAVSDNIRYDGFGNVLAHTGTTTNPYDFTSAYRDPTTRWVHLGARDYQTSTGRFTTGDPSRTLCNDPFEPAELLLTDPLEQHAYLYCRNDPLNRRDRSGLMSETEQTTVTGIESMLARINVAAVRMMTRYLPKRLAAAFAAGGTAVGRMWNWLGNQVSSLGQRVFGLFPELEATSGSRICNRIIDFALRTTDKVANLEIKYKIPVRPGDALNRLAGQMAAMVTRSPQGEQAVVWVLKEPRMADMQRLQVAVGLGTFNQVQFVYGVKGLFNWISLYFGIPAVP